MTKILIKVSNFQQNSNLNTSIYTTPVHSVYQSMLVMVLEKKITKMVPILDLSATTLFPALEGLA